MQRTLGAKKREAFEGGRVQGTNVTFKEYFTERVNVIKKLRSDKSKLFDQMNKIKDKIIKLEEERGNLRKGLVKGNEDPAKIIQQIEELEHRFQTTTINSPAEEKKALNDIKVLK